MENTMKGKRVLVTGATQGIGRAAAVALAKLGAEVVIVGRDPERTRAVAAQLKAESNNPSVDPAIADLSSMAEVRRLAREVTDRYSRLDVLLNNAGGYFGGPRKTTRDGYEMTFALDHLGYFALTRALLDLLKRSAPARIVSVSSGAQAWGRINFDDPMGKERFSAQRAYNQAKLANVMFTFELARRLKGSGVTATVLHPGVVRTNFGHEHSSFMMKLMIALARPFMLTPQQGADTAVWLASSPDVVAPPDKYFIKRKPVAVNRVALDESACSRLWELSERLVDEATSS